MSRHGYSDDHDQWDLIRWRGAVRSAIRGKRGQSFLIELRDALDALPTKELCAEDLQRPDGACCAIGAVGKARGIDMTGMDAEQATDDGTLSEMFDIAGALVKEIEYENDEGGGLWFPAYVRSGAFNTPTWTRDEKGRRQVVYRTNDLGERVNEQGMTKAAFDARQDHMRWRRVREWVAKQIKAPARQNPDTKGER